MSTLDLNCFILGDDPSKIFYVEILNTESVTALKTLIKKKLSPKLNHVAITDLTVWKVSLPADAITQELTAADVPVQPLCSVTRLSSIFNEAPVDEYVHILVQVPPVNQPVAAPDPAKSLTLNCLLLPADEHRPFTVGISRDRSSNLFDVHILKTQSVSTLRDLIKETLSPKLNHVVASELTVRKVSVPLDNIPPELTVNNVQPLEPLTKISSVFSEALEDGHIHVLVQAPPAPESLTLNCLLLPADEHRPFVVGTSRNRSSNLFDVHILKTQSVSTLKDLIKETLSLSPKLNHVVAAELTVWKVSVPLDNIPPELTVNNVQPLEPLTKISSVFSEALEDGHIHVLVQPPPVVPQKRGLPISEGLYERAKRSKIVITPPSIVGIPDFYHSLQKDPSEKILDDCPELDSDVAPAALLYEGFGHFLDIMDGRPGVPGLADIDTMKLFSEVDQFACKMNEDYAYEDLQREAVLPYLNRIFKARRDVQIPSLHASAIGSVGSDGPNDAAHGSGTMVVEFKNRITGISAIPEVELTGYVARLNLRGMEVHRNLHLGWRVPHLGLIIVGHMLQFYAVIAVDHRFKLVSLTSMYSCIQTAFEGRDRKLLYLAFTAASVLRAQILHDIERLCNNPPSELLVPKRGFPAVSKLRSYPPSDDHLHFGIQSSFPDRQSYRFLYVAETQQGQPILVKFSRSYSIRLHGICARLGHAPHILAFERLPGGWYAVAMEYIEHGVPINLSPQLATHGERWDKELWELMNKFHSEGVVHGDLRDANILCKDDSVKLIDFDWGGTEGTVSYPTGNLNKELLEGRVSTDLKITKEDDRRVLKRTLENLRNIRTNVGIMLVQ
ncbi:hypothetical protein EDD15DRAFT_2377107 [Pisolithus albus]|nr:hypothetical protein EDD15DRAFT_2377107 [Pisolithus albus]